MIIRDARAGDASRLAELLEDLGHPIADEVLRQNLDRLTRLDLVPLVAVEGEQVVGLCALWVTHTLHRDAPLGRISTMIVASSHRGQGIGAALVGEAERRLQAMGCIMVEVTSNDRRKRAHAFYERLGYERTSARFSRTL